MFIIHFGAPLVPEPVMFFHTIILIASHVFSITITFLLHFHQVIQVRLFLSLYLIVFFAEDYHKSIDGVTKRIAQIMEVSGGL
jgi:hypothetical protein